MRRISLVVMSSLVMAACGGTGSPEPGDVSTTSMPPVTSTSIPTATTEPGETPETDLLLVAAVDDLLGRVDADRADIEVVSFESGTWNDGSLGCPEDGMSYTQALVEGYRIKLMVNGTVFVYAQGGDEPVFYCEQPNEDGFKTDFTLPRAIDPPADRLMRVLKWLAVAAAAVAAWSWLRQEPPATQSGPAAGIDLPREHSRPVFPKGPSVPPPRD